MKAWCAEQNLTVYQLKYWLYKALGQAAATGTNINPSRGRSD
ncbi:hypothetical protein ACFVQB_11400 [Paenibacillus sp. NPDC057886]